MIILSLKKLLKRYENDIMHIQSGSCSAIQGQTLYADVIRSIRCRPLDGTSHKSSSFRVIEWQEKPPSNFILLNV